MRNAKQDDNGIYRYYLREEQIVCIIFSDTRKCDYYTEETAKMVDCKEILRLSAKTMLPIAPYKPG